MRQGGGPDDRLIRGDGPTVPTIVFHGDRDVTVHPNNGDQILKRSIRTTSTQKKMHRGRVPGGHALPARSIPTRVGAESLSTGASTELDTHGREAARQAPTLIREGRTQRGKCCVSSSSIRFPSSQVRVGPLRSVVPLLKTSMAWVTVSRNGLLQSNSPVRT
jgi:hypothetical protein